MQNLHRVAFQLTQLQRGCWAGLLLSFAVSDSIPAIYAVVGFVFLCTILGCWNRNPGQPECCHGSACLVCQPIPGFMGLSNCWLQLVFTAARGLIKNMQGGSKAHYLGRKISAGAESVTSLSGCRLSTCAGVLLLQF